MTTDEGCTVRWADPPATVISEKTEMSKKLEIMEKVHLAEELPPVASICKLFSLVDFKESVILLLGMLGAIGNGVTQPVVLVVFGDLIDGMGSSSAVDLPANFTPEQMAMLTENAMDSMMSEMERLCIIMCLIGVANTVAATLQGACFKIFSDTQTRKFRILYFKNVLFQDVSWFDLKEVAALPSEINDDLEKIADAFGDKLGNGVMSFSAFFGGFGCAFGLGWLVALVMCAMLPFMGVGAAVMGKAIQEIQLESQSWYSKAASVVEECLYAMRTVVAFGGEHRELQKFQHALIQTRHGGVRNGFKIGLGLGYTTMIIFAGNALAFWFGMTLRYHDHLNPATGRPWEPGNILAIFFCVFTGSFCIGNLDPSLKALQAARFAAGRFFQVQDSKPQVQCADIDRREDIESIESFQLQDVHFYYPARPDVKILNGLSLQIIRGQKVAVVGESGSGKSTVMALLERFYDPNSGVVLVNGQDMKNFKVSSLRRCLGYVGQEPVLFAGSIHHNIMQGNPEASKEQFAQACADAHLAFVDGLPEKYNTFVGAGGCQLSGGQKQRIAIARALVKRASFLFLDEATSALDNASEKMIQQTIDTITSGSTDSKLGIVSIAHRLSTVRRADVIYVLSRGRLVETGTHASLMQMKGLYFTLVAAQESSQEVEAEEMEKMEEEQQKRLSEHSTESEAHRVAKEKKEEESRVKAINKNYKAPLPLTLTL